MKGFWICFLLIVCLLFLALAVTLPGIIHDPSAEKELAQAGFSYSQGEKGSTVAERKNAFNQALKIYTDLESKEHPQYSNGKLYFNIANTFFQLGEYPQAVLYYYRALSLRPSDEEVYRNLSLALSKLKVPPEQKIRPFRDLFYFHTHYSLPQRLQFFFINALILLIFSSLYIWFRKSWLKYGIALFGFIALIFLLSVAYTRYLEPVNGVLVRSAFLYRDAGDQYAKATSKLQQAGLKVEILDSREEGRWIKIITPDGSLGYVPVDSIQAI